jgi:hypothetical protein
MKRSGRSRLNRWQLVLLALGAAIWIGPLGAQSSIDTLSEEEPFGTGSSRWDGYAEFVRLAQREIGAERVVLTKSLSYAEISSHDAIIIAHPTAHLNEASLSSFLVAGGRLAVLDDFGQSEIFLRNFGIIRLPPPPHPSQLLRGNLNLPVAVPSVQITQGAQRGRHPVAAGVERVMTNHPRVLQHPELTPVLEIVDKDGRSHALAVTGVIAQRGRLFALGDPSVFINLMLRYPDNRKLAEGLIHYLTESRTNRASSGVDAPQNAELGKEQRPARLYILTNGFHEEGSFGNEERLKDKLDSLTSESVLALRHLKDEGMTKELALALAALTATCIFLGHIQRNLRFQHFHSPSYAFAPALAAQVGPASRASVLSSRNADPILALMELDSALRDAVTRRLKQDGGAPIDRIIAEVQHAGLSPDEARLLKETLSELKSYGQSLGKRGRKQVSEKELKRLHTRTMALLHIIESNKMSDGSPNHQ